MASPEEIRYKQLYEEMAKMMVYGELDQFDMLVEFVDQRIVAAYNAGIQDGAREERDRVEHEVATAAEKMWYGNPEEE